VLHGQHTFEGAARAATEGRQRHDADGPVTSLEPHRAGALRRWFAKRRVRRAGQPRRRLGP